MSNDVFPTIIITFSFIAIVVVAGLIGAELAENSAKNDGRNQGIIFCTKKPQECKTEYEYLKLKETQK